MDEHIRPMAKISNREKILTQGLKVVHAQGFSGASVRDIVEAAGVPQGSFTNHFATKEAFGVEILNLYFANAQAMIEQTLLNNALSPLTRLRAYIDVNKRHIAQDGMRNGCLLGNFSAEVVDYSESIRERLVEIFAEVETAIALCLHAAVQAGELSSKTECSEVASLILSSLQGAILLAKAKRDPAPINSFERLLFSTILQ